MTARIASIIGMEPIAQTIERFGIMDHTPREYSMALGTGETTALRLTTAYAVLVNGGKRLTPTLIAGKTGTTNDFRDAWFVGGTPDLTAGVFIGYDDPDSLGDEETGGHIAAPVFRDFMIAALKDAPATAFRTPPGMRLYRVNPSSGLLTAGGSAIYEAYTPGTEPGTNRNMGLQGAPGEIPIWSTGDERPLTRDRAGGAP